MQKTQRVTILIDGVEYKGIVKSMPMPGLMGALTGATHIKFSGLVDNEGNKHEDIEQAVQNLRVGKWEEAGLEITSLELIEEVPLPEEN